MTQTRVIIVEDEADLAAEIAFNLREEHFDVVIAHNADQLDRFMARSTFDVVIIDIGLDGEDGLSIARRLSRRDDLRLVMLTARADIEDRVQGIEAGVDVYLTKPVDSRELAAVIRRQQRRITAGNGQWTLDLTRRRLCSPDGRAVDLTQKEYELLELMRHSRDHSVDRGQIALTLWPEADRHDTRRLEVLVHRLREKLATRFGRALQPLRTIRGYGYHFAGTLQISQ